jgi:heat-inducible transcriptional repressor
MRIEIGGENQLIQMNNVAVVSSRFKLGNHEEGELMVVGPSRMQYNRVVALMEYMSEVLEEMYKEYN